MFPLKALEKVEERNLEEWGFGYIKDKVNGLKEDIKNKVEGLLAFSKQQNAKWLLKVLQ